MWQFAVLSLCCHSCLLVVVCSLSFYTLLFITTYTPQEMRGRFILSSNTHHTQGNAGKPIPLSEAHADTRTCACTYTCQFFNAQSLETFGYKHNNQIPENDSTEILHKNLLLLNMPTFLDWMFVYFKWLHQNRHGHTVTAFYLPVI